MNPHLMAEPIRQDASVHERAPARQDDGLREGRGFTELSRTELSAAASLLPALRGETSGVSTSTGGIPGMIPDSCRIAGSADRTPMVRRPNFLVSWTVAGPRGSDGGAWCAVWWHPNVVRTTRFEPKPTLPYS
jgi:hypothetical protein